MKGNGRQIAPEQIELRQQKSPAKSLDVLRTDLRCAIAAALRAGIPPWAVCGELDAARREMEQ